jgi:hypothetical protein
VIATLITRLVRAALAQSTSRDTNGLTPGSGTGVSPEYFISNTNTHVTKNGRMTTFLLHRCVGFEC